MPQTETISQTLTDRLNQLMEREYSEFEIQACKRDAEKLLSSDAAAAYDAFGMIAALEYNLEESVSNHKRALNLSQNNYVFNANFAVSLDRLGMSNEASYYFERARGFASEAGEADRMEAALFDACCKSGRIKKALEIASSLPNATQDEEAVREFEETLANAQHVYDFMLRYAISDSDIARLVQELEDVAGHLAIACLSHNPFVFDDEDEGAFICFNKTLVAGPETAVDLNEKFYSKLTSQKLLPQQVTNFVNCSFLALQA